MKFEPVTADRPPFVYWACLWGLGLSVTLAGIFFDILQADLNPPGRDFANLYAAGKLVLEGNPLSVFDLRSFRLEIFEWTGVTTLQNYSYPPHALLIAAPFALLPYWPSFILWTVGGAAFFAYAAKREIPFSPMLAVITPAAGLNIWNGHYGFLLGGLWLLFFRALHHQPMRAGLIGAVLTFKPHMGLFIGLAALTKRRAVIVAIAASAALFLLSVAAFGIDSWEAFALKTSATQTAILTRTNEDHYFRLMPTAFVAMGRGDLGLIAHILFAGAALALLARRPTLDPFALATATFIILPYAFNYDMTVACLGMAVILYRDWATFDAKRIAVLSLAFLVPNLTISAAAVAPPMLLAALWIQLERATPIVWRQAKAEG